MSRPVIETARLRLVPWGDEHTALLVRLSALPAVMRRIGDGIPWPRSRAEEVAATMREHWAEYGFGWRAAVEHSTGEEVGLMALNFLGEGTAGIDPREYEIGWWLEPAAQGRGLAREGATALCAEAFEELAAPSAIARIQPGNEPSIRLAAGLGMEPELQTTGRFGEPVGVHRLNASGWLDRPR